ncbi:stage V sporulation protein B [Alteribacillus persepolensis]|uniref:Stage V sporulation protein B n=1 Tax=Alteribacillus persepolensis TaxID=568899 RepID=A0A1G8DHS5_9BACI|nr:stage V sporulation protein B [Alteribacillus persepolensis]SDH57201.1 stage V sporulation protein B [Alteribacillus persepolensis]
MKQTFIQGTLILIIAGLITRILGFINRIVTAKILGAEGVGLYMMAFPTLLLIITLTQLGLPVAISKLIAEAEIHHDTQKMKRVLVVSLCVTGTLSILFTAALMSASPLFAAYFLTDERALYPLIAITPIIPIVAVSAVLRGYFQGRQNMKPTAISQVIEQAVRISLVAVCTKALLPYGLEFAAAGAMLSVVAGELASLLFMMKCFKNNKPLKVRSHFLGALKEGKTTFQQLMNISLPATGSRMIGSISLFLEPIIIAQSLALAGVATAVATAQYGELSGFVIPLLLLPTFITYSFSVTLVPNVSEAAANNNYKVIQNRLRQTLRTALLAGVFSSMFLYVFAELIMTVMYDAPHAAYYIKILAPFSIFLYLQGPLQAVLQGLDLAKSAMVNTLVGAIIKMAALFVLTSQPELGIKGAALAIALNMMLVTLLHLYVVSKAVGFIFEGVYGFIVLLTSFASVSTAYWMIQHYFSNQTILVQSMTAAVLSAGLYLLLLLATGLIKWNQLKRLVPKT